MNPLLTAHLLQKVFRKLFIKASSYKMLSDQFIINSFDLFVLFLKSQGSYREGNEGV